MQAHGCGRSGNESTESVGKIADATGLINGYGRGIENLAGVDGVGVADDVAGCKALVSLKWGRCGATGIDL